jgi:ABC-type maltose transport system permease subunit
MKKSRLYNGFIFLIFTISSITVLVPVGWVFLAAFKQNREFYGNPWTLPQGLYFQNFIDAFRNANMGEYMLTENYDLLTPRDEVKFVVSSRRDFDYAVDVCCRYDLFSKTPNLLVSPVWGKYEFKELAQWVIEAKLPLRLQLQFHKIIWGDMPGV